MPKQARALRTYDRVLDAAAHEFARFGYTNANLQNIADRIGLTKGALYGHFSNKEDLAAALTEHLAAQVQEQFDKAMAPSGPALDRLRALLSALAELFEGDARAHAALRLVLETAQAADRPAPLLDRARYVVLLLVREVQREGDWDASFPSEPLTDLIVTAFVGAYWAGPAGDRSGMVGRVAAMWLVLARALRCAVGR